jgi:hypothetical protein
MEQRTRFVMQDLISCLSSRFPIFAVESALEY